MGGIRTSVFKILATTLNGKTILDKKDNKKKKNLLSFVMVWASPCPYSYSKSKVKHIANHYI